MELLSKQKAVRAPVPSKETMPKELLNKKNKHNNNNNLKWWKKLSKMWMCSQRLWKKRWGTQTLKSLQWERGANLRGPLTKPKNWSSMRREREVNMNSTNIMMRRMMMERNKRRILHRKDMTIGKWDKIWDLSNQVLLRITKASMERRIDLLMGKEDLFPKEGNNESYFSILYFYIIKRCNLYS